MVDEYNPRKMNTEKIPMGCVLWAGLAVALLAYFAWSKFFS